MIQRNFAIFALFLTTLAVVGCSEPSIDRDTKREMDRISIDLTQAQKERDEYKAKYEKATAELQQVQKENAELRAKQK